MNKKMFKKFTTSFMSAVLFCFNATASERREESFSYEWGKRTVHLVEPNLPPRVNGWPLVIVMGASNMAYEHGAQYLGFDRLVDTVGLVIAYPEPFKEQWAYYESNDPNHHPDIFLMRDFLARIRKMKSIDASRIYLVGYSDGGTLSHRVLCGLSGEFAAATIVNGLPPSGYACPEAKPTPLMLINGDSDPLMPVDGGSASNLMHSVGLEVDGLTQSVGMWARINGCDQGKPTQLDDFDKTDGTVAVLTEHKCKKADFIHLLVRGGGHAWPGGQIKEQKIRDVVAKNAGRGTNELDATSTIWSFFRLHQAQSTSLESLQFNGTIPTVEFKPKAGVIDLQSLKLDEGKN